jgi:hypothetical protein
VVDALVVLAPVIGGTRSSRSPQARPRHRVDVAAALELP